MKRHTMLMLLDDINRLQRSDGLSVVPNCTARTPVA